MFLQCKDSYENKAFACVSPVWSLSVKNTFKCCLYVFIYIIYMYVYVFSVLKPCFQRLHAGLIRSCLETRENHIFLRWQKLFLFHLYWTCWCSWSSLFLTHSSHSFPIYVFFETKQTFTELDTPTSLWAIRQDTLLFEEARIFMIVHGVGLRHIRRWSCHLDQHCLTSMESPWPNTSQTTGTTYKTSRRNQMIFFLHLIPKQVGYWTFRLCVCIF